MEIPDNVRQNLWHGHQPPVWMDYCFLLVAAAFLYLDLFILPATPIYDLGTDQLLNLHNATRMLHGQMIYRDFFQFTTHGAELVYVTLFRIFGVRTWIPNAMLTLLGLSVTWLSVFISRKILSGLTVYLPGLLFLLFAFHPVRGGTHHWYSILAVIAAAALIIEKRSPTRVAGAAALCATASFFTQTRGVAAVAALAVFLWWEHCKEGRSGWSPWKVEVLLTGVFSAVTVGLNLYFVWVVGVRRFLWSTVIFVLKYYPTDSPSNNFRAYLAFAPSVAHWYSPVFASWVFIHALLPFVYLPFFVRCWRESQKRPEQPWGRLMLVSLVGFSLFGGVAPAPDYWRLCNRGTSRPDHLCMVGEFSRKALVPCPPDALPGHNTCPGGFCAARSDEAAA